MRRRFQTEFRVCRPNGEVRWCIGTAAASVDATGNVVRISGVTVDITERKQAEERQALLAREVDHRARNALAVVQSIVRLTRADTIKAYIAAVDGRIGALSRAHTLLAQSRWQGADLARLVEEELAPYRAGDDGKITANGPDVSLEPRTAQTLALALHELATNAAKYGALSVMPGRVGVTWELQPDSLVLRWSESGGPATEPPASPGFGIRVISASIERQLEGETAFHWRPEGLHCSLRVPRGDKIEPLAPHGNANRTVSEDRNVLPLRLATGNRILLVEDEILVAMMMKDILAEFGLLRCRTVQPGGRGHGCGRARGLRCRHHRRQSGRRIRLPGRRRAGGAGHSIRLRHGLWRREHRKPVRSTCRSSRSRSSARCCRRCSSPRRVSPPTSKSGGMGRAASVARHRPASPDAEPPSRPRFMSETSRLAACIDFQL